MRVVTDDQILELIAGQPETVFKLEAYELTRPRLGTERTTAALCVIAAVALFAIAILVSQVTSAELEATLVSAAFGTAGFAVGRLVTDLIEANRREAARLELGDLIADGLGGAPSEKGRRVLKHVKQLRAEGALEVSGAVTPREALVERAALKRAALLAASSPAQRCRRLTSTPSQSGAAHVDGR